MACAGVALYGPFWLFAGLLILIEDGWPILFLQERVGQHRVPFAVIKLRTMRGAKTTRLGRWLRATGLDETTQFLNVLAGDMRMVGPRPLTARDVERLGWRDARFDARFDIAPGITGLAQLFGGLSARHSLKLDELYRRRRSPDLDVALIILSALANLLGKRRLHALWRGVRRRRRRLERYLPEALSSKWRR